MGRDYRFSALLDTALPPVLIPFYRRSRRSGVGARGPASLAVLQAQLDVYRRYDNAERPHRALRGWTPLQAFNGRIKASPTRDRSLAHFRVRQDRVSKGGSCGPTVLLRELVLDPARDYQPRLHSSSMS